MQNFVKHYIGQRFIEPPPFNIGVSYKVRVCMNMKMYVCIYMDMYMYTHTHRHTHTGPGADPTWATYQQEMLRPWSHQARQLTPRRGTVAHLRIQGLLCSHSHGESITSLHFQDATCTMPIFFFVILYIYVYVYMYVYIYIYTYIYVCVYVYIYMCVGGGCMCV